MTPADLELYPQILRVIDMVGQGRTTTSACDELGVSVASFNRIVSNDDALSSLYHEAEQRGYDALAEALLEIDRHPHYGSSDSKMASVISRNIQWFLARRDSKRYGDKTIISHEITADKAIIEALSRGKDRAIAVASGAVLEDVQYAEVETTDEEDEAAALAALL